MKKINVTLAERTGTGEVRLFLQLCPSEHRTSHNQFSSGNVRSSGDSCAAGYGVALRHDRSRGTRQRTIAFHESARQDNKAELRIHHDLRRT